MKMMVVVVGDRDAEPVLQALVDAGHRATRMSSTGAFLRRGVTTLLIGMDDDRVDSALQTIRASAPEPEEPGVRRATVFILDVARYEQL